MCHFEQKIKNKNTQNVPKWQVTNTDNKNLMINNVNKAGNQ